MKMAYGDEEIHALRLLGLTDPDCDQCEEIVRVPELLRALEQLWQCALGEDYAAGNLPSCVLGIMAGTTPLPELGIGIVGVATTHMTTIVGNVLSVLLKTVDPSEGIQF
jgi:hypothetical protein